jgi:small-conductance mechanosensitive channel
MRIIAVLVKVILLVVVFWLENYLLNLKEQIAIPAYMIISVFNFLIFLLGANLLVSLLSIFYRRQKKIPYGQTDNVLLGLQNVFYLLTTTVFIITVLALFGIDVVTLFTSLSIVAAAIAIVTKDYLNEIISGIIISFSQNITLDDYIKINGQKGTIIGLNLTKVILMSDDEEIIFIPNHKIFTGEVVNYTGKQVNRINIEFEVDIKLLPSIESLEEKLAEALLEFEGYIVKDSQNIKVADIKKDLASLKFQYSTSSSNREIERLIRKRVLRSVIIFVKQSAASVNVVSSDTNPIK